MREKIRKCALATLVPLIVTISLGNALKTPDPSVKHEGILNNGKEDITQWHGLDYEYGMFHPSQHKIGVEAKTKNETHSEDITKSNKTSADYAQFYDEYSDEWTWGSSEEYDDDDDYDKSAEHHPHQHQEKIATTNKQVMTKPPTTTQAPSSSKKPSSTKAPSSLPKEDDENDVVYWHSDEKDSDDGLDDQDAGQKGKPVSNLPSDNDLDADKYLNPDRYNDQLNAHQLEDHMLSLWTVQYQDSHLPCIMLRGHIKLIVPVNPTWFNREFVEIDVPQDAEASGTCNSLNNDYQEIKLKWNVSIPEKNKVYQNSVYFAFATNWTSEYSEMNVPADKYALIAITVAYYNGEIGNGKEDGLVSYSINDLVEYMTPLNQSISCYKDNQQMIIGNMQLMLRDMQMEAFRPNSDTLTMGEFSMSVLCTSDEAYIFDAVMSYIIWFWIGALIMVLFIFGLLLALGYRRRRLQEGNNGFGYKILSA